MTRYNKRIIGSRYEEQAAAYLRQQGLIIQEQNYRDRYGEIDLIAKDGDYLVFVEVKYRRDADKGNPLEAVSGYKQRRIRKTAQAYLYTHRYSAEPLCRFDVVGIMNHEIQWIKNAF